MNRRDFLLAGAGALAAAPAGRPLGIEWFKQAMFRLFMHQPGELAAS